VPFAISAAVGEESAKTCKEAKGQWRIGGAIGRASVAHEREHPKPKPVDDLDSAEQRDQEERVAAATTAEQRRAKPPVDRGFYCANSPTVASSSLCTKAKDACESARAAALGFVPDLSLCTLVEVAWCVGEQCAGSAEACEARRAQTGSDAPACSEQR
jgi:hypothetical protein